MADGYAKVAAECTGDAADRRCLREASLAHLTRRTAEARTEWIAIHAKSSRRYTPPGVAASALASKGEKKLLAGVYYQKLLSGHAATGAYLADKIKKIRSSECWWCGSGERQARRHLFVKCRTCVWKSVAKACGWKHSRASSIRMLFQDGRATPAVLTFLREIKIGRMINPAPPEEEE